MKYLLFNPNYVLKPDDGKALLMVRYLGRNLVEGIDDSSTFLLHPIHAMILSFMDGREDDLCIHDAAECLDVPVQLVKDFVDKLTDNPNEVLVEISETTGSHFFPKTIISCEEETLNKRYTPEMFDYTEVKIRLTRHKTPSRITLMFNNICYTDCIYCYEDKSVKMHCQIPFERIIELIHEARKLNVITFDVVGGEFFLYDKWREVLAELRKYDFDPYLSTKMPIGEEDVKLLADLKVHDIQVSLDSLIEEHLIRSIRVKEGYVERMNSFLDLLDKYGIPVMLHTVLTQYNDTVEDMASIYDVLKRHKNIHDWHIVKGEETLYPRTDYTHIEISPIAMKTIADWFGELKKTAAFPIVYPEIPTQETTQQLLTQEEEMRKQEKDMESFFSRAYCSGLFTSLYILPTGKVTICEQLYWQNPRFYVGDVMKNSLEEIWNSKESNDLFYLKQSDIPEDSLCHICKDFSKCREGRQVCYREIIKKYGKDKWYYPDVACPYAKCLEK